MDMELFLFKAHHCSFLLLGLVLGSFLNVLVDRGRRRESVNGRSRCDFCKKKIAWYDNLPVVSFLILRGRCRHCHKKLSWQYPLVEILMGIYLVTLAQFWWTGSPNQWLEIWINGDWWLLQELLFILISGFLLAAVFLWDLKYMLIPNRLVALGLGVAILQDILIWITTGKILFIEHLLGAVLFSGFFFLLHYFSKGRWIGGGDVKLGFWLGYLVSWKSVYPALLLACVIGAIISLGLVYFGKKGWKSQVPFGPFLIVGSLLALMLKEEIGRFFI
jgi:prepilin signal peptidase PulO-like enzyme (type II secretory pathway)